jgi:hypothetical protein
MIQPTTIAPTAPPIWNSPVMVAARSMDSPPSRSRVGNQPMVR